VPFSVVRLCY